MTRALTVTDSAERADLAQFVGRVVRLDPTGVVRLRAREDGTVAVFATTGFDVVASRTVEGTLSPVDTTVNAADLLTALAVLREPTVDPGFAVDASWRSALPPVHGFRHVDDVPSTLLAELSAQGVELSREHAGPQGPPPSLLDSTVLTVRAGGVDAPDEVGVPLRCVFALSGMGFVGEGGTDPVRVRVTDGWLRLDARYGSVLRRRHPQIPLLVTG